MCCFRSTKAQLKDIVTKWRFHEWCSGVNQMRHPRNFLIFQNLEYGNAFSYGHQITTYQNDHTMLIHKWCSGVSQITNASNHKTWNCVVLLTPEHHFRKLSWHDVFIIDEKSAIIICLAPGGAHEMTNSRTLLIWTKRNMERNCFTSTRW